MLLSAVGPGTSSMQHTEGPAAARGWERASPHFSLSQLSWPQGLLELKAHVSSEDWWERRFVSAVSRVYAGDAGPHSLGEVTFAAPFRILTSLLSLYTLLNPHPSPTYTHLVFIELATKVS